MAGSGIRLVSEEGSAPSDAGEVTLIPLRGGIFFSLRCLSDLLVTWREGRPTLVNCSGFHSLPKHPARRQNLRSTAR